MFQDDLLSIDQAARYIRRPKRELRELVRGGRIPAVRRDAKWMVQRRDLVAFMPATAIAVRAKDTTVRSHVTANSTDTASPREEILAFISLLRDRDDHVAQLQDERARLAGQVGYLQAQLAERDARLAAIEATRAEPHPALPALADGGGSQTQSSTPGGFKARSGSAAGTSGTEHERVEPSTAVIAPPELANLEPDSVVPNPDMVAAALDHSTLPDASPAIASEAERQNDDGKADGEARQSAPPPNIVDRQSVTERSRALASSLGQVLRRLRR